MNDQQRDTLRKTILETLMKKRTGWTDLKKKVLGSCHPFATDRTFTNQMKYLEMRGYIKKLGEKRSLAPYEITEKGKVQLSLFE